MCMDFNIHIFFNKRPFIQPGAKQITPDDNTIESMATNHRHEAKLKSC